MWPADPGSLAPARRAARRLRPRASQPGQSAGQPGRSSRGYRTTRREPLGDNRRAMRKTLLTCAFAAALLIPTSAADEFTAVADWLKLPEGRQNLGNMHGDVAVSS